MKNILRYIIAILLTVMIIAFLLINLLSSTILNKKYILSKLEETNYYNKMYEYVQSNFKNYIYQSGLDENVLDNIISKEKIENDTKIIIGNIYDGLNEAISTQEIQEKLSTNINDSLKSKKISAQKDAIEKFINEITNEYTKTMSHTSYETQINKAYTKGMKYIEIAKKILLVSIIILIILVILLSLKQICKIFTTLGISMGAIGTFFAITNWYITTKIKIHTITILNDAISEAIRNILQELLDTVKNEASIFIFLGIVTIIISNFVYYYQRDKKEKNTKVV